MNLQKIKALHKKAAKEAQKAVDNIFKKYDNEMNSLIKEQLPEGTKLISGNGMCWLENEDGDELKKGNAWSIYDNGKKQLQYVAELQYLEDYRGGFNINEIIKN